MDEPNTETPETETPRNLPRRRGLTAGFVVLVCAASLFVGAAVGVGAAPVIQEFFGSAAVTGSKVSADANADGVTVDSTSASAQGNPGLGSGNTAPAIISDSVEKVMPTVVGIGAGGKAAKGGPPFFSYLAVSGSRVGAGVIFRNDGYILTNEHVVKDSKRVTVALAVGQYVNGDVVGTDKRSDIAVVKIPISTARSGSTGFVVPSFSSDVSLKIGETIVAIGSPGGLQHRVTVGTVSAVSRSAWIKGRPGQFYPDLIEIDGAISEGSSGGPVVNTRGEVVGIGTLIVTGDASAQRIGFAIPSGSALEIAKAIIAGKKIDHPYVGIVGQNLTPAVAKGFHVKVESGAIVSAIIPASPAERAGVLNGDIVTAVDGRPVQGMPDVVAAINAHAIGDRLRLQLYRGDELKTISVEIRERPASL